MDNSNTTQLNKDKTKNIIITAVAILLIAGGVYYSKVSQKDTEEVIEEEDKMVILNENEVVIPEENTNAETLNPPTIINPEVVAVNKTKFNTLLQEGSEAFMDKNYALAIKTYNEALVIDDSDVVYIRLYGVYNAQGDTKKAEEMLNKAIDKNPTCTDYWTTKLAFLNEKKNTSFVQLKVVYEDGLKKVESKTKVNFVTYFARIAENDNEKEEAVKLWEYAIEIYPQNKEIYQKEIDALK